MKINKNPIALLVLLLLSTPLSFAQDDSKVNEPQTLNELQESIQKVLIETNTPGAGIVMVAGDETILLEGFGKADIENDIDVNENTMFRLGSVSKLFVGLAILKLQEEGRLNLKDKLRDIIPDIKIINPWEDQNPIRIENLLEHTAGLSDYSLAELGSNDPKPKTLKESLEYYPKGRVAKYVPGTQMQYSNLGVSIAAYIVETVSGIRYEDYIDKYFFKPIGVENMTFFYSKQFKKTGAKGYENGIPLNIDYLHVLYRPSAALNGSPKDMVNMIRFFIDRGRINNTQIISDSSMQRMERNESIQISKLEMFKGQGLGNSATHYKSFVYHGHGGHAPGYSSDFCYLPEYNMGYAIMINGDDLGVVPKISSLIKAYQTKDLPQEPITLKKAIHNSTLDLSGYYISVNSKFKISRFFDKMKYVQKIWYKDDTLCIKYILNGNSTTKYIQIGNEEFRSEHSNRIGFIQVNDPIEGQVIYGNIGILKKISPIYANTLLIIFWAFFFVPVTVFIFALLQLLIYFFGKKKDKVALWICLWPFVSISVILVIIIAFKTSIQSNIETFFLLGNMSPLSILVFMGTIGFALASFWTLYYLYKNRHVKMSKIFYYHSTLAAIFNLILTIYFLSNGLIGIQTWI